MSEFSIPAPELARLTHNALAFMPARSAVKVCRVQLAGAIFSLTATDLRTVGHDWAEVVSMDRASIDLSREDLQALDQTARAAKKEDVRIVINHEDGMEYFTEDTHGCVLDASAQRIPADIWDLCDELLSRESPEWLISLDPKLFNAFGKVKPFNGKECIADTSIPDSKGRLSLKIGATFRGAIMPVDREEAAASERIGSEGLFS